MNVLLTPEAEKLVNEKLRSGEYQSPAEVIEDALQLLKSPTTRTTGRR